MEENFKRSIKALTVHQSCLTMFLCSSGRNAVEQRKAVQKVAGETDFNMKNLDNSSICELGSTVMSLSVLTQRH